MELQRKYRAQRRAERPTPVLVVHPPHILRSKLAKKCDSILSVQLQRHVGGFILPDETHLDRVGLSITEHIRDLGEVNVVIAHLYEVHAEIVALATNVGNSGIPDIQPRREGVTSLPAISLEAHRIVLATCIYCGAPVMQYIAGAPVCIACSDEIDAGRTRSPTVDAFADLSAIWRNVVIDKTLHDQMVLPKFPVSFCLSCWRSHSANLLSEDRSSIRRPIPEINPRYYNETEPTKSIVSARSLARPTVGSTLSIYRVELGDCGFDTDLHVDTPNSGPALTLLGNPSGGVYSSANSSIDFFTTQPFLLPVPAIL
jgi:hypothetical protein